MAQLRNGFIRSIVPKFYQCRKYTDGHFFQRLKLSQGGSVTLHRHENSKIDVIRLDQTEKKNAISGNMILQMSDIITKLESSSHDKRAILITGAGDAFCAGADLNLVESNLSDREFARDLSKFMCEIIQRLSQLPTPTIALIDGPAFGGGAELAIGCDLRLTTPSGQLSFVHAQMGLSPAFGGATRLAELVGAPRALDLLITGRNLQGKEIVDWSLASGRVIGEEEAITWIQENLRARISTQTTIKRIMQKVMMASQSEAIDFELLSFCKQWGGEDHLIALKKYRTKME